MTTVSTPPLRRSPAQARARLGRAALVCLFGASTFGTHATVAAPTAPTAGAYTWHIETVDSTGTVGQFPSLALQPGTGKPHISHYDNSKGDLKLAFPVPAGSGDCGPQSNWSCNSLAFQNSVDYGLQSSIDFPSTGTWAIAYDNTTLGSNDLRGIPAPLADDVFWEPIEAPGNIAVANTLRFDQSNISHVSYGFVDTNAGKAYIKHAMYHGLGGNCGAGLWRCETVVETTGINLTLYNTLVLMRNLPMIFYADMNRHLALAINAAVNCGEPLDWNCSTIDISSTVNGLMSAAVIPEGSTLGVAYLGVAYIGNTDMRYAHLTSGSGNCGNADLPMQCDVIDAVGADSNNQLLAASMALYNGKPVIAYTAHIRGATVLKVAYPQIAGNCGPMMRGGTRTWRCEVVDAGAGADVGYYPSIKIDAGGRVHIAYYDFTNGDLKYALSDLPLPVSESHSAFLPLTQR